jgi:hypothetical protein
VVIRGLDEEKELAAAGNVIFERPFCDLADRRHARSEVAKVALQVRPLALGACGVACPAQLILDLERDSRRIHPLDRTRRPRA